MARGLAALLTLVSKMKWTGNRQQYKCDYGAGGAYYHVGTAKRIWNEESPVSKSDLAQAGTCSLHDVAGKAGPDALKKFRPLTVADIKAADVAAMQKALLADFQPADEHWDQWSPF